MKIKGYIGLKWVILKEVIFANRKILHLARIYFRELASLKHFAGINFAENKFFQEFRPKISEHLFSATSCSGYFLVVNFIVVLLHKISSYKHCTTQYA